GRHRERRKEMTIRRDGRPARTLYRTLAAAHGIALLEIDLATGRTHQIRVHLKSLGHPLVGDPAYGEARWKALPRPLPAPLRDFPPPHLHAGRLRLPPATGATTAAPATSPGSAANAGLTVEAPFPADLRHLWETVAGAPPPLPPAAYSSSRSGR